MLGHNSISETPLSALGEDFGNTGAEVLFESVAEFLPFTLAPVVKAEVLFESVAEFFPISDDGSAEIFPDAAALFESVAEFLPQGNIRSPHAAALFESVAEFLPQSDIKARTAEVLFESLAEFLPNAAVERAQKAINPKRYHLRIREARVGANGIVEYDLVREDFSIYDNVKGLGLPPLLGADVLGGSPGEMPQDEMEARIPGSTRAFLLDIPALRFSDDKPGFYAGFTGTNEHWRGAILFEKVGTEYAEIANSAERAAMGFAATRLLSGPVTLFDESGRTYVFDDVNTVDITLLEPFSSLSSTSAENLLAGMNGAAIGAAGRWELISFGNVEQLDERRYRLSHLLRGLKGTEWAIGTHQIGDQFVRLDGALRRIHDDSADLGKARIFRAVSIGANFDDFSDFGFTNTGVSSKPLSAVFLRGEEDTDQNRILRWWRRSRINGLAGRDGTSPPPLGEAFERYEIDIRNAAGTVVLRTLEAAAEFAIYTRAMAEADFGSVPSSLRFCVYQLSDLMGRGYAGCALVTAWSEAEEFPLPPEAANHYDIYVFAGGTQVGGERILVAPLVRATVLPAGLPFARALARAAATGSSIYSIRKNGSQFATATFSAAGTVAALASAADVLIDPAAGDYLEIVEPATPDATLADVAIALAGVRI